MHGRICLYWSCAFGWGVCICRLWSRRYWDCSVTCRRWSCAWLRLPLRSR
ncbi:MAG: hypothetical protein ACLU0O_07275 [Collinsella sp.]